MKDKLLKLLQSNPTTAGRPSDFLDTLAEDLMAVVIRAVCPGDPDDSIAEMEHAVEDVWVSQFGVSLFNLYGIEAAPKGLLFSDRKRVVRAMLQTMLIEQSFSEESQADVMKRRLQELAVPPKALLN